MTTRLASRALDAGDHACAIYSSGAQLVRLASRFLAHGLERYERCWYVGTRSEGTAIRAALRRRGIDVDSQIRHGALSILLSGDVYVIGGEFQPQRTIRAFGDAVRQSVLHGFRGFRVAADMSWTMMLRDIDEQLIAYEAEVSSLFTTPATALCLYSRRAMPLHVLRGALATHPVTTATRGQAMTNPFYDRDVMKLVPADDNHVRAN
ncbi:MAG TPA: MEDS domain-containing protein, partial [Vicinamibacterales bacterium]|nr:MEDS domain-containing protein [Vicinamibacterales bacterium]